MRNLNEINSGVSLIVDGCWIKYSEQQTGWNNKNQKKKKQELQLIYF